MADQIEKKTREAESKVREAADSASNAANSLLDEKPRPHQFSTFADGAVLVTSLAGTILYFTSCESCYFYSWYLMGISLIAKGAASLFAAEVHTDPASAPKKVIGSVDGIFLILGGAIVSLFPSPTIFLILSVLLHTLIDIVSVQRPILRKLIPNFDKSVGGTFDKITPQILDTLRLAAAALELVAFFVLPFCGSFLLWVLFIGFLLLRYRSDRQARQMWKGIAAGTDFVGLHPALPPAVSQNYTRAKDGLHQAATSF